MKNIFKVMVNPRGFIRKLPKSKVGKMPISIAWIVGMVYLLKQSVSFQLSFHYPYGLIILAAVILAIPFGYIINYLICIFVYWAGKIFKGKATFRQLFSAIAYAKVTETFILISWLLLTLYVGQAVFTQAYILIGLPQLVTILITIQIVFYIWEFVITLHTIGEVQGFSAWMGLWNYIFACIIVIVIALIIELIIATIFSFEISHSTSASTLMSLVI